MAFLSSSSDQNLQLFINTRRFLLLSIILIWGTVGLIFFAIKPQVQNMFALQTNLSKEREKYQNLTRKMQDLNTIEISAEFQQKDKVDEVLPSYKPVLELLFNLNQAMNRSEVQIESLMLRPGEIDSEAAESLIQDKPTTEISRRNPYRSLATELAVVGFDEDVDYFLDLVERIAPFTSIVELTINRSDREDDQPATTATMILNTYYYTQTITTRIDEELPSVDEEELRAFQTIQEFTPSGFEKPEDIQSTNVEDLFGIRGFEF